MIFALVLAQSAVTAPPRIAPIPLNPNEKAPVVIDVPQSQLNLEKSPSQNKTWVNRVSLSLGHWAPQNIKTSSLLPQASAIQPESLPAIYASMSFKYLQEKPLSIRPLLGIGYQGFKRTATSSSFQALKEYIPSFSLNAGAELASSYLSTTHFKPYLGLAARSLFMFFPASSIGLNKNLWGYTVQGSLGFETLPWASKSLGIDLGIQADLGRISAQQLRAWGFYGGVRWDF